jgi:hypothetical protein
MREGQETAGPSKLWWGILLLIVLPLYAIAAALVLRSHVFAPNQQVLSTEDVRALWAFIASGIGASITLVGLLFTRSHNERTLALQAEAEKNRLAAAEEAEMRLTLDTVVKGLDLVATSETYAPSAKIAGALSALVHLNHPVIAMRTLSAAWTDGAVDVASATWLINEVFEHGSDQSRLEAAVLLDVHAEELCTDTPGIFYWPASAYYKWPEGMQLPVRLRLLHAIFTTLTSEPVDWWRNGGRVGWALSLLDEVVEHDNERTMKVEAAVAARTILNVVRIDNIQFGTSWKPVKDIRSRVMNIAQTSEVFMLSRAQEELKGWVARGDQGASTRHPASAP